MFFFKLIWALGTWITLDKLHRTILGLIFMYLFISILKLQYCESVIPMSDYKAGVYYNREMEMVRNQAPSL